MVSLFEMIVLWSVIGVPIAIGVLVAKHFGPWAGIVVGSILALICAVAAVLSYRARSRSRAQRRQTWKEQYGGIYRVIAAPADEMSVKKSPGAEVKIGDCGWEAVPFRDDGLIYLQGLNPRWRVVWYAGFRPDQIEKIGPKPLSQYDWDETWVKNPPPCPFPVAEYPATDMGLPMPR